MSYANYYKIIKCPFKLLQVLKALKRLIPNAFEFATFFMNVDNKWQKYIQNLTLYIPSWSPIGWFLLSLFPIGWHLHFHYKYE
jgi:hypothetical protein